MHLLTDVLSRFIHICDVGAGRLESLTFWIFGSLLLIDVVLTALYMSFGEVGIGSAFKKLIIVFGWTFVIFKYRVIADGLVDLLIGAGLMAGGQGAVSPTDHSLLRDPSRLLSLGLKLADPLREMWDRTSVLSDAGDFAMFLLGFLFVLGAHLYMTAQAFLAVVEYHCYLAVAVVALGFAPFGPGRFLAEKAIGAIAASALKLMVLSFILAMGEGLLESGFNEMNSDGIITLQEDVVMCCGCLLQLLIGWMGGKVASAFLSGSPSLSMGDAMRGVASLAAGAAAVMSGVGAVAGGAAKTLAGAAKGVSSAAGAAAGGFKMGSVEAGQNGGGAFARFSGGVAGANAAMAKQGMAALKDSGLGAVAKLRPLQEAYKKSHDAAMPQKGKPPESPAAGGNPAPRSASGGARRDSSAADKAAGAAMGPVMAKHGGANPRPAPEPAPRALGDDKPMVVGEIFAKPTAGASADPNKFRAESSEAAADGGTRRPADASTDADAPYSWHPKEGRQPAGPAASDYEPMVSAPAAAGSDGPAAGVPPSAAPPVSAAGPEGGSPPRPAGPEGSGSTTLKRPSPGSPPVKPAEPARSPSPAPTPPPSSGPTSPRAGGRGTPAAPPASPPPFGASGAPKAGPTPAPAAAADGPKAGRSGGVASPAAPSSPRTYPSQPGPQASQAPPWGRTAADQLLLVKRKRPEA